MGFLQSQPELSRDGGEVGNGRLRNQQNAPA